jgi:hypothetical protein
MVPKILINLSFSESRKLALQNNIEQFSNLDFLKTLEVYDDLKMSKNRGKNEFLLKIVYFES